jgi:hypothetical protein
MAQQAGSRDHGKREADDRSQPRPGPAPVGPAVDAPEQQPARTPTDPGPAPVGPAVGQNSDGRH